MAPVIGSHIVYFKKWHRKERDGVADFYGSHFEYGGLSSRYYNLIIANVDTDRLTQLHGQVEGVTVFSKIANKQYLVDDNYSSSPITFEIEFVTDSGHCLNHIERRHLEKWLFNRKNYQRLYMDIADDMLGETYEFVDGEQKRNYLNCRFVNPHRIEGNGGVVGYRATVEADSLMLWQDSVVKTFDVNNESSTSTSNITVEVDTDLDEYIYPVVTIELGDEGGDIAIFNNSDDSARMTRFTGIGQMASIVMKGELNYVSNQYYEKFYDRNFIRLLDGENVLTIAGNVRTITFEYSARRAL